MELQQCRARESFVSQISVTTEEFDLPISCMKEILSSNPIVVNGICDPNIYRARAPL